MTNKKNSTSNDKAFARQPVPLNRLASKPELGARSFEPTFEEASADKKIFEQLRYLMLRSERLWLLDCDGDYEVYRRRLRSLAGDYKIPIPPDRKPEE